MARISLFFLLLGALISLAAASAPTFCKCTCFKNSTIIPLGPKDQTSSSQLRRAAVDLPTVELEPRSKSKSCSECTKAFCLKQGIDFCKDATEEDVSTMCFQRDSNKDKIIVWGFIVGTVGLLGWAAFKKVVALRQGPVYGRQSSNYAPMPGNFR
ncbi:major facilitator superfamily transporter [Fusarium heterosporum]|uniref:Major facilitator superfamily transporter n=1 Tax=Fusarium heterosporum TaxID=42747 RepID=A0A8H5TE67_FUSHE|nr:major facilitator superfamily transporter [Fusarium heterosporum]